MKNLKQSLSVEQLENRFEMSATACNCFNGNDVDVQAASAIATP